MIEGSAHKDYSIRNFAIGTAGLVAGWESQTLLQKYLKKPVAYYVIQQLKDVRGGEYRSYLDVAIKQNNLQNSVNVINLNKDNAESVLKPIKLNREVKSKFLNLLLHILRINRKNGNLVERTIAGQNAFYSPKTNSIVCNFEKFGAPAFHELVHRMNATSSNILIKGLVRTRNPLAFWGPLFVSGCALFTDKKENTENEKWNDKIKNNCGKLAALALLPLTVEECIANIKGTKIAQKAGVTGELLKKVKKGYKISIISYVSSAVVVGLSAWGGNKIRDEICSFKK